VHMDIVEVLAGYQLQASWASCFSKMDEGFGRSPRMVLLEATAQEQEQG